MSGGELLRRSHIHDDHLVPSGQVEKRGSGDRFEAVRSFEVVPYQTVDFGKPLLGEGAEHTICLEHPWVGQPVNHL